MSTQKVTGPNGVDYAMPYPLPKAPVVAPPPVPPVKVPNYAAFPPVPPFEFEVYPYYPPYPNVPIEPVPMPYIPGKHPLPPVPPCPPPPVPPCPPPFPPYPVPKPEKVDECSKRLAKLSQKTKVLVQMIKDFEDKNRPVIITIGPNSYQFGTENITDFDGNPAKGMYATLISGDPIEDFQPEEITIDSTGTRVAVKNPVDLLQTELARVRKEITLVAAKINDEITPAQAVDALVPGTDENH